MKPYIGLVHKDRDGAYGVSFPDAPGCFSAADDLDALFPNAEEALQAWREACTDLGTVLPQTRDLSAIKADPQWAPEFSDVAIVIAIPGAPSGLRNAA